MEAIGYLRPGFPWPSKNGVETYAFSHLPGKNREWGACPKG